MIRFERLYALAEQVVLPVGEEGCADAHALLRGAHGVERIDGYAVIHQLTGELEVCHAGVLHREIESVGKRRTHVVVVNEIEAVGEKDILHELCAAAVFPYVGKEIVGTVAGGFHQCGHGVLNTVGCSAGESVHEAVGEEVAELADTELLLEGGINAMIEVVAYAGDTYALACVGEGLGTGDGEYVVVGIACDGRLIWCFKGVREVAAEVHGEVCEVFKDDKAVLCGQTAYALEFLFVEADPRGVVGIGIDDAADVVLRYDFFQFVYECRAAIAVDVKADMLQADYIALCGLHRKAGIDEQYRGLAFRAVSSGKGVFPRRECGESALHGACCGYATEWIYIHSDESLDEL